MNAKSLSRDVRPLTYVASSRARRYLSFVTANSVTGFGDLNIKLAHMRPKTIVGAFFVPAMLLNGGRVWDTFGYAGCQLARFANLCTAATNDRLATVRGSSISQVGASPMKHSHALNPSEIQQHAASLKARAFSALRANSSLSVRLHRYNVAMAKARALEVLGGAQ